MIDLNDLKYIYESLLGGGVNVEINNDLSTKHYKMQAVLFPTRQPYKLADIESETFTLSFEFYANVSNDYHKLQAFEDIGKIIGYKAGNYIKKDKNTGDKTYKFYSYLDLSRPLNPPQVERGEYKQILTATGTLLVRDAETGAVVGNDITTALTFKDGIMGELTVLNGSCQAVNAGTAVNAVNSEASKTANSNGAKTYSYRVLVMRDPVSVKLAKAITGHTPLAINETVTLTETYPDFTVEKECVIISSSLRHDAGAFAEIDVTLQEKADFLNADENEV